MRQVIVVGPRDIRLDALVPQTHVERARGLIGRAPSPDEALLLEGARSIHTFGMRVPIRAALLDAGYVVRTVRSMPPGRLLLPRKRIRHVLEGAEDLDLRPGDHLRILEPG